MPARRKQRSMPRVLPLVLSLATLAPTSLAPAIAGIHVGDRTNALESLHLTPTARETVSSMETLKYQLANGNELSVTYDSTKNSVVYVECDWGRKALSAETDFPGFKFGVTSLEDIRQTNGSNGFTYRSRGTGESGGELFTFNAYDLKDKPGIVVIFVTSLNIEDSQRRKANKESGTEEVAKNLKLDALILAEEEYLDKIWGKEKTYDKEAKPIIWGAIR